MYWKSNCSNAPALPINCTKTRNVYKSKAFCFHISFCSYPHLWSWVLGNDRNSEIPHKKSTELQKVGGLSLLEKVKSTSVLNICQSLNIEPLLPRIEQSQLRWYGHVTRMSHKRTAKQLMDALPSGKRPRWWPRTRWRNYVKDLAWSCLGIPPTELPLVAGDWDVWRSELELLPPQPQKDKWEKGNTLN